MGVGIGDVLRLDFTVLPLVGTPAFVQLGFSRTWLGPIPLPLGLAPLGMPGCTLYQSGDLTFPVSNVAGAAQWILPLPLDVGLLGFKFYNQGLVVDLNANRVGLIWSNAGEARIGA